MKLIWEKTLCLRKKIQVNYKDVTVSIKEKMGTLLREMMESELLFTVFIRTKESYKAIKKKT